MNDRMSDSAPPRLWDAPPAPWARGKLRELWGIDLRSLALLRIGLGASVLADVAIRAFDLVGLYTDRGVLPRALVLAMDGPGVYLSTHYWASANPLLQGALFADLWWSGQAIFYALHLDEYATTLGVRLRDYPSWLPLTM